jgi:UDP-2,3-diacylglucosamine hydrolase
VLAAPCFIVSDSHLGAGPPSLERELVSFLKALPGRAGSLLINGDLFDFWFEWRRVVPRVGIRVIAALADLRDAGVPVLMIAGNHDCWGGEVLREDAGVDYRFGPWEGDVAGWRARVEHGDGLREVEDRGYRRLRTVLRHPLSIRAFRWVHPDLGSRLAAGSSHASRTYRARDGGAGLRRIALETLAARADLELVVFGHSHVPALERAPSGGVYANAGSWLDAPTYVTVSGDRVELRRWGGSAESERLDVVDRRAEKALGERPEL